MYVGHPSLHVLTHPFPTRRSSYLFCPVDDVDRSVTVLMNALVFCTAVFVATAANAVAQDAASPVAPEPATTLMQPLVVSGKQPGPGLWRVSKDDQDLWVLGDRKSTRLNSSH